MGATRRFEIRRASPGDGDAMAAAHLDSIASIGPRYYAPEIVREWGARVTGELYATAMARGEVFFIAVGDLDGQPAVLGFSSHRTDPDGHGTAVYVRGRAARQGIGAALFAHAEASAIAAGAPAIDIEASLAAVEFYRAQGFEETGRGAHRLRSGGSMPCVFMRKALRGVT
jgi:putative acetyltransferase